MMELETYLDNNKIIYEDLDYKNFNFFDKEIFEDELTFLLENVYDIKILESDRKRIKQKDWALDIKSRFNNKCVITKVSESYLEACHLLEINEKENYDLDNGILLTKNLHTQFDNHEFGINPYTYCIEVKEGVSGDIFKYKGDKLDLPTNYNFKKYLEKRYESFLK